MKLLMARPCSREIKQINRNKFNAKKLISSCGTKLSPLEIIKIQRKKSGVFQLESIVRLDRGMPALLKKYFPIRTFIQTINTVIMTIREGNIRVKAIIIPC